VCDRIIGAVRGEAALGWPSAAGWYRWPRLGVPGWLLLGQQVDNYRGGAAAGVGDHDVALGTVVCACSARDRDVLARPGGGSGVTGGCDLALREHPCGRAYEVVQGDDGAVDRVVAVRRG
jgi:hypothetical protein